MDGLPKERSRFQIRSALREIESPVILQPLQICRRKG